MLIKEIDVSVRPQEGLTVDRETLQEAGLGNRLRMIVQRGEIRILGETATPIEMELDELAGCLGQESAADYDFSLKIGGLYEAR
jgi:hypothetical protein